MNALSRPMRQALIAVLETLDQDDSVRAVVLTGNGRAFCAGLDLKEIEQEGISPDDLGTNARFVELMRDFTRPIIGAINGFAITGGFELALACDFMIAGESAKFADTHGRVGVIPGWGLSQKLPRMIGVQRAKEISFTGNFIDAHKAERWGLVNQVVADAQLIPTALKLAQDMASCIPETLHEIKRLIDYGWHSSLAEGLEEESTASKRGNASLSEIDMKARRESVQARGRTQSS